MNQNTIRRPVKVLSPEVARKIAAGEVIDRPNAIVRELLDNAVDSGADSITVEIEGGGIEKIRITDNGQGMTREDLINCAHPHATSKITDAQDLMNLSTLGFRGEALSSIAAVSRLSISSGNYRMHSSITEDHKIEEIPAVLNGKGTIVMSEGLFENYPARRMFLKRPASENLMCRETFVEKALPRTDISFRLTIDGQLRLDLPKDVSLTERFVSALELKESPSLFYELKASAQDWSFKLIIGDSSIRKNDRKNIFIYVNGRKVSEYSLVQAIEYGCQGFFPNGVHPVAALFVQIKPSLVDFNIHPAKKEVRFKDSAELHHGVSSTVKDFFKARGIQSAQSFTHQVNEETNIPAFDFESPAVPKEFSIPQNYRSVSSPQYESRSNFSGSSIFKSENSRDLRSRFMNFETNSVKTEFSGSSLAKQAVFDEVKVDSPESDGFMFLGTALNCFLIAQLKDTVYFIDQHAAHERILFNKILASGGEKQALLIPYVIETDSPEEDNYLESIKTVLDDAGFEAKNCGEGRWEFSTAPVRWTGTEADLKAALMEKKLKPQDILYSIAAMTACKAAVKDGYILDRSAASDLARQALALTDPHCPHGRPVWTTLTKEQLFARVRRTES